MFRTKADAQEHDRPEHIPRATSPFGSFTSNFKTFAQKMHQNLFKPTPVRFQAPGKPMELGQSRNDLILDTLINRLSQSHSNAKEAKNQFTLALHDFAD